MDSTLLTGMLTIAVMGEMTRVTEASMELFLADRDRWGYCTDQAAMLRSTACEKTNVPADERTPEWIAEYERLGAAAEQMDKEAQQTNLGLIVAHGDDLMFGGRHCAKTFAAMAFTIAHLARHLGGVEFAGLHWCAGSGHQGTKDSTPCDAELARERAA